MLSTRDEFADYYRWDLGLGTGNADGTDEQPHVMLLMSEDMLDKVDRVGLIMFVVDFERPDTCCVIDSGILDRRIF